MESELYNLVLSERDIAYRNGFMGGTFNINNSPSTIKH